MFIRDAAAGAPFALTGLKSLMPQILGLAPQATSFRPCGAGSALELN